MTLGPTTEEVSIPVREAERGLEVAEGSMSKLVKGIKGSKLVKGIKGSSVKLGGGDRLGVGVTRSDDGLMTLVSKDRVSVKEGTLMVGRGMGMVVERDGGRDVRTRREDISA